MGRTRSVTMADFTSLCFFVILALSGVSSQDAMDGDKSSSSDTGALTEALTPVYKMTRGFVEVVQPNDLTEIEEIVDKWTDKFDQDDNSDVFNEREFYEDIASYMVGFIICVALGLMLIVLMIFTGCFMFCCRCCCGKCGGRVDPQEGRNSARVRLCCGVLIFIFNTILLAGCLVLFMSNELLQEQTSREPQALLPQVSKSIKEVDRYKDTLMHDVRVEVVDNLQDKLEQIVNDLRRAPQSAKNALNAEISSTDIVSQATDLVDSVETMNRSMVEIQLYSLELKRGADSLNNELIPLKNSISSTLSDNCPATISTPCNNARTSVNSISIMPDFNNMYDITSQLSRIQDLLSSNPSLTQLINRGVEEYDKVSEEVASETETQVNDTMRETEAVNAEVSQKVDEFEYELHKAISLNATSDKIEEYEDEVETYGTYRWYAGIAIGCMFLLIVVFYYFGLVFGCTGEPPYEDGASTCNRGVGANLFMAGVVFTFLFFWLLMIILIILFLIGGPMYSEVCRNLIGIENSPATEPLDKILQSFLDKNIDVDYDVNVATVLKGCKNNGALYQVFSLDQIVNLTAVLDLDKYDVEAEIQKIKTININFGTITILDGETEAKLRDLANAQLDSINFDSYYNQLDLVAVQPRLSTVATTLDSLANDADGTQFADALRAHARDLRRLDTDYVAPMERTMPLLKESIQTLQGEIEGNPGSTDFASAVNKLINDMTTLETELNTRGGQIVTDFLVELADSLYGNAKAYVEEISNGLQNEVGKCLPLYNAIDLSITAGCESFLDPWNAFWFSMGWCLIALIPCMIVALVLVSEYRKTDDYEAADNKSFDDPNFDAYAGSYPGDNIPLEDVERRKSPGGRRVGGGGAQPNTGYDGTPNSNFHRDNYYLSNGHASYDSYSGGGGYPASSSEYTSNNAYHSSGAAPPNPPHHYNNRNYRPY